MKSDRRKKVKKTRAKIREVGSARLTVYRTPKHIYAQVFTPNGDKVHVSAATVEEDIRKNAKNTGNTEAAKEIGKLIAERAIKAGIETVSFDRSGYLYHGRVKALADSARENGLKF